MDEGDALLSDPVPARIITCALWEMGKPPSKPLCLLINFGWPKGEIRRITTQA